MSRRRWAAQVVWRVTGPGNSPQPGHSPPARHLEVLLERALLALRQTPESPSGDGAARRRLSSTPDPGQLQGRGSSPGMRAATADSLVAVLADPDSWPAPSTRSSTVTDRYGRAKVTSWS